VGNGEVEKVFKEWKTEDGISKWAGIRAMATCLEMEDRESEKRSWGRCYGPIGWMRTHECNFLPQCGMSSCDQAHAPTPDSDAGLMSGFTGAGMNLPALQHSNP
jgi:hypothetical protein